MHRCEWDLAESRIRLGIPRRRNNRLRLEIQHAACCDPPRDTAWSIEEVR